MRKEERDGDMLNGFQKSIKILMNMMRTLKPLVITITQKKLKSQDFSFSVLDTSVEKNKSRFIL